MADINCGGGHGSSHEIFGEELLIKEGIFEIKEVVLLPSITTNSSKDYYGKTDEDFDKFVCLQITGMSINDSIYYESIPVTDEINCQIPASIISKLNIKRFAKF